MQTENLSNHKSVKSAAWQAEWDYRYMERLGILTDGDEVTPEIRAMAKKEADEAEAKLSQVARELRKKLL